MSNEESTKFFEKSLDLIRKKALEKEGNLENKARILASVGASSGMIGDFDLILALLNSSNRIGTRRLACRKLAEAGFLDEARTVLAGIPRAEDSIDLLIEIASISREENDFRRVSEKIEDLNREFPVLNENDKRKEYEVEKFKKYFIEKLARAGKYQWALCEIEKLERKEFLYGLVSQIILDKAYEKKEVPGYIVNDTENIPLAFRCAIRSTNKESSIIAVILLLSENKIELARELVESVDDSIPLANYIKAGCYVPIATETKNADDIAKAFEYAMRSKSTDPKSDALRILINVGISLKSLYHLGIACDVAFQIGNEEYELGYILSQLSKLKTAS